MSVAPTPPAPAPPGPAVGIPSAPAPPGPGVPARLGWAAHYLLRLSCAASLLVYGWSKVFLTQMGRPDYGDALVTYGEMSPMGVLWRFMGFSPVVQFVAGAAEVLAGALLLWRRTALVGAILGALDMWIVFGTNVFFDVPVKQLALALALGCTVAALPYAARVVRALLTAGPVGHGPVPRVFTGRLGRVTGVLGLLAAVGATALSGIGYGQTMGRGGFTAPSRGPLVGVHRVVDDTAPPAARLADDTRWQQVAFGQWDHSGDRAMSLRQANGDLRRGTYRIDGDRVRLEMRAVQRGVQPVNLPVVETWELTVQPQPDGRIHLVGAGQDLTIAPDPEARFLFDRDFSWAQRIPVNR